VSAKTYDGRTVRMLNLIDEHSRECLLVRAERRWSSAKVIEALADVMVIKGVPEHLRSDNGPEFVAHDLRKWLADTGAKTASIEPGSPWENGYCESFNSKLRDEFLNGELFYSMKEIRVLAERWRVHYNTVRPHSSLGYRPPAPEAWMVTPGRILQRSEPADRCATLTIQLVQKVGQTSVEYDYATFTSLSSVLEPAWAAGYPSSKFINIVYDTSAANVANVLTVSIARNVGAVYVTDQTLPNPYAVLPSYWSTLTQSTQACC